jgi:hypothetical protein
VEAEERRGAGGRHQRGGKGPRGPQVPPTI